MMHMCLCCDHVVCCGVDYVQSGYHRIDCYRHQLKGTLLCVDAPPAMSSACRAALMTQMRDGTNRNHSFVGLQSLCAVPWHKQCLRCGDPSVPCSVHVTTPPIRSHFILLAVTLPFCRSVCLSARLSLSLSVCSLYTYKQPLSRSHTPEIIEVFARGMLHLLQRMVGK